MSNRWVQNHMVVQPLACVLAVLGIGFGTATALVAQSPAIIRNENPEVPAQQESVEDSMYSHLRLTGLQPAIGGQSPEQLLLAFADQHTAGNYKGAVLLAHDLISMIPDHPEGYYNLACAQSRLRQIDEALESLNSAVDKGWRRAQHTRIDPDLEPLRRNERFAELLSRMESLAEIEEMEVLPLRTDLASDIAVELDVAVPALLHRYHVPGVVVAFIEDGEIAWVKAFGRQGTISDTPMTADSRIQLQRPIELLALMAAGNESAAARLDLARLLSEADHIGLRGSDQTLVQRSANPSRGGAGHSRLANLPQRSVTSDLKTISCNTFDWFGSNTIKGTIDLMVLGIELTSEMSFSQYCENMIFQPAAMIESEIYRPAVRARANRRLSSNSEPTTQGAESDSIESKLLDVMLVGHTRFGTPIISAAKGNAPLLETTIHDLSRLIGLTMTDDATGFNSDQIRRMINAARTTPLGVGLSINSRHCDGQPRLQFAELNRGLGVLARWYPNSKRGIVVLFNSENGPDVATRIANQALGGG